MKKIAYLFAIVLLSSCASSHGDLLEKTDEEALTTTTRPVYLDTENEDSGLIRDLDGLSDLNEIPKDRETSELFSSSSFVLITDTGTNYNELRKRMDEISALLELPIDTMGRGFNLEKNLISCPDDDKDPVYAGKYFPRRYVSENCSLEYLNAYKQDEDPSTIAIVVGIYTDKQKAIKALTYMEEKEISASLVEAKNYWVAQ